jgi:hypothetical protein
MTLIKSVLLGSAATLVVVAGAQAADLPTKKGAPAAEYVKVCKVGGVAGFVIPGSDTCLKISGGVFAMASVGNLSTGRNPSAGGWTVANTKYRDNVGLYGRADLGLEAVSNTANGPLVSVIDIHWDQGAGMNGAGPNWTYINNAYIQWAGLTAGIHTSFYDYIGGGETWFNIISPEHTGTGVPLFAYTATFGGGFSATISAEENTNSTGNNGRPTIANGPEQFNGYAMDSYLGERAPDIVGSLDLTQSWGTAHLEGVSHNYRNEEAACNDVSGWCYGVLGGIGFNLPQLGAGDVFKVQAAYSHAAVGYSGFTTAGWGGGNGPGADNGLNINGNGYVYSLQDAVSNNIGTGTWTLPTTWEVAAVLELNLTPQFSIDPEISYGQISWSNRNAAGFTGFEGDASSWLGGVAFHWKPVTNLSFNLDVVYQSSHFDASRVAGTGGVGTVGYPASNADGFNGRILVERDF